MDTLSQLDPCPFCGSTMILIVGLSVRCHHCSAEGPFGYSVEQAIILWNERVPKTDFASQRGKTDGQSSNKGIEGD